MTNTFSPQEQEIMQKCYANTPCLEMMALLPGKTRVQINQQAIKMGIRKDVKLVKGFKGKKKPDAERKKKISTYIKKGREAKPKGEKKKERVFKTKVVDPSLITKVQVDYKTWIEVPKNKNIDEVVARYHERQATAFNQLKR